MTSNLVLQIAQTENGGFAMWLHKDYQQEEVMSVISILTNAKTFVGLQGGILKFLYNK